MEKSYHIRSWQGGISDAEDAGIEGAFKFGSGLNIRKKRNTISCNQALVEEPAALTFTALALFIVPAVTGDTYFFCKDGKIIKRTAAGAYSLVYTDADGAIIGAAQSTDDQGSIFLHWATSTKLNVKKIKGTAYSNTEPWNDQNSVVPHNGGVYPKSNLTAATWHTMLWAVGNLYIANDDKVAIAAYDGSYSPEILRLFPEYSSKCLLERSRALITGCSNKAGMESSGYFAWDCGASLNYDDQKPLPTKSINAMIDTERPLLQVGTDGQIITCDFSTVLPLKAFPGGGQCYPDAVCGDGGMALFGVFGNGAGYTGIYSFGRKELNKPFVMNLEYPLTCDEIGSIKKIGADLFVSYRLGTTYGVKKLSATLKETGIYQSINFYPSPNAETDLPIWKGLKIELEEPLPENCTIKAYRRINKTGNFVAGELADGTDTLSTTGATEAIFNFGDQGEVCEFQIILTPSGNTTPEVKRAYLIIDE